MVARDFADLAFPLRLADKDAALALDALNTRDLAVLGATAMTSAAPPVRAPATRTWPPSYVPTRADARVLHARAA
jgi:hypothetical protein